MIHVVVERRENGRGGCTGKRERETKSDDHATTLMKVEGERKRDSHRGKCAERKRQGRTTLSNLSLVRSSSHSVEFSQHKVM